MGYRGEDLDLRTPQTWSATLGDLGGPSPGDAGPRRQGPYGAGRGGPIWVDETLLACCNHAFDVALAHRAGEVKLEHLVHALTRIDAAVEALEARGIRVTALRRESATIIASEIPVVLPNGKGTPRRSEDLEDVLRLAATHAGRRNAPAGVDDVLHVMLEFAHDLPGLTLLRRAAGRGASEPAEALGPLRHVYGAELADVSRERLRASHTSESQRGALTETAPGASDPLQNSRLNGLERMVRTLTSELANERKIFSGVLHDLQREIMAQRDETTRVSGDRVQSVFGDRLQNLEQAILNVRPASGSDVGSLHERISALERTLQAALGEVGRVAQALTEKPPTPIDLAPISSRLDVIEEAVLSRDGGGARALSDRLAEIEQALAAEHVRRTEVDETLLAGLRALSGETDKSDGLIGAVESHRADMARDLGELGERMGAVERSIGDYATRSEESRNVHAQELSEVHDALVKLNSNQHMIAGSIDRWREESAGVVDGLAMRLDAIERDSAKLAQMLEDLSAAMDKMHRLTVEKYYRRNRFWYWLFGTDDWIAASWPSQSARISKELESVKTALKR